MNKKNLSRRGFIRSTSVMAAGVTAGALTGNGCSTIKSSNRMMSRKGDITNQRMLL